MFPAHCYTAATSTFDLPAIVDRGHEVLCGKERVNLVNGDGRYVFCHHRNPAYCRGLSDHLARQYWSHLAALRAVDCGRSRRDSGRWREYPRSTMASIPLAWIVGREPLTILPLVVWTG